MSPLRQAYSIYQAKVSSEAYYWSAAAAANSAQAQLCVCFFLMRMCRDSISDASYGFELLFLTT
jgi:hypothetical protein